MDLLVAWLLFPLVLAALCGGCGLLVDRVAGGRLPVPLVFAGGFCVVVVAGQFLTLADGTAELTAPAVVVLALAGLLVGRGRRQLEGWGLAAGVAVLAVYAAPIVLSGEPTIAGFIKLDDTATWLTLTDRLMEHGRDLDGLAPSTYEATLHFNLGDGYPVGSFVPFGVAAALLPTDPAWLIQPYIAFTAALLALALWSLASPLAERHGLRAATAVIAAQPALLFGYYLWGGIKEVAGAAIIATFACVAARLAERPAELRAALWPAVVAAALLGVLSTGGLVWLALPLVGIAVLLWRRAGAAIAAARLAAVGGAIAILSLPVIISGSLLPPTSSPLTDGGARGNLIEPLKAAQVAGIWPAGDFRLVPDDELVTYLLIAIAIAAAVAGLIWSVSSRRVAPTLYVAGTLAGCAVLVAVGSPWVGGKALATASPAIPFAAMLGAGWMLARGLRPLAIAAGALLAVGVVWSNALGYGGVSLAPHGQFADLERIGDRVAGQGPTLMTEYEPYGVRHFLRDSDPEGISELRRRTIPLRDGTTVPKGESADTDRIDPAALAVYRTLVLRRSPTQSRPPAPYRLIWRGEYYEAWQRPARPVAVLPRLGLGDRHDPYAVPRCDQVLALARQTDGGLVAAAGERPVIVPLSATEYPRSWSTPATRYAPVPRSPGTISTRVSVERPATYEFWLGGSLRPQTELIVDGRSAGEIRGELNNDGGYVRLGSAELEPGAHTVEVRIGGADLHPGSAGDAGEVGPLVVSSTDPSQTRLIRVRSAEARELCGRAWDWIEVAG